MNTTPEPANIWRPQYPESKEEKVTLETFELQTFMSDRRPGITVLDYPLKNPACFWIDYEHVYLRVNWSTWCTISLSNPEQVAAICNAHYCRISHYADDVISDCTAPVYRIAELPKELFADDSDNKDGNAPQPESSTKAKNGYQNCIDWIKRIVKNSSGKLSVFPRIRLEDNQAAVAISDDSHAIIMDFLPEDRDFVFIPANGDNRHKLMDKWPTDEISLDFIEKLKCMQKCLSEMEPDSTIDVGFLANTKTIESLRAIMASEEISDFKLFSYEDLYIGLASLFSLDLDTKNTEIAERVKKIIIEHLGVEVSKVQEDARLIDDLGADELDIIELFMAFEESFECVIPDDVIETIHTVKDVIDYIEMQKI